MDNQILNEYQQREDDLLLCLQYSSWVTCGGFTDGERIMINQERGALFEAQSNKSDFPRFRLEGELAEKVDATLRQIEKLKWNSEIYTNKFKN